MTTNDNKYLVAVLPGGQEIEFMFRPSRGLGWSKHEYERACGVALAKAGITTPRDNPQSIFVELFERVLSGGDTARRHRGTFEVVPPVASMTPEQFEAEIREALQALPEEFCQFVRQWRHVHGHSAGSEACLNLTRPMLEELRLVIVKYTARVQTETRGYDQAQPAAEATRSRLQQEFLGSQAAELHADKYILKADEEWQYQASNKQWCAVDPSRTPLWMPDMPYRLYVRG